MPLCTVHQRILESLASEMGIEANFIDKLKGRGVVTTQEFRRGDFITTYKGEIITQIEALKREEEYETDPNIGPFCSFSSTILQNYGIHSNTKS